MKTCTKDELTHILEQHALWLVDPLTGARANLSSSNLSSSNLSYSNLSSSNLSNSDLSNSDLSNSDLSNSDLSNSDLRGSNLSNSDLSNSDLSNSDLRYSNLSNSDLRYSNLLGALLPPATTILQARWGEVPADLCVDLMIYDAWVLGGDALARFNVWAAGGPCPYEGANTQRAAHFEESKELWGGARETLSPQSPADLVARLFEHAGVKP